MKKQILIAVAFTGFLFMMAMVISTLSARTTQKATAVGKPIPANIMKTAEKSCVDCHGLHGNRIAMAKLNLSKWDSYAVEKQAAKAKAMCNMVTKEKMPPKNFRSKHPEKIPVAAERKAICDWSASLQTAKK